MTKPAKEFSVVDFRNNMTDIFGSVFHTREPVVVERHGKPQVVLIHPDDYERLKALDDTHSQPA